MEAAGVPSPGPSFRVLVRDSTLETGRCFVTRDGLSRAFGINNVPSMGCDPVEATLLDADDGSSVSVNLVAWTAGHCRVEGLRPWLHRRGVCIGQKLQVERSADGKTVLRVLPGTAVATAAAAGPAAGPSDAHRTAGGGGGPAPCGAPSAAAATAGEDIAPVAADRTAAPPLQQQQQQCSGRARLGQGIAEQARQRKRICREPEQQQQRQQGQPKASDQEPRGDLKPRTPAAGPANRPHGRRGGTSVKREGAASGAVQHAPQQQQEHLWRAGAGDGGGGNGRRGASVAEGAGKDVQTTMARKSNADDAGAASPRNTPGGQQAGEGAARPQGRGTPGANTPTQSTVPKGRGKQAAHSERHDADGAPGLKGLEGPAERQPVQHGRPAAEPAQPAERPRPEQALGRDGKGHVPGQVHGRQARGCGKDGAQGQGRRGESQGPGRAEGKPEAAARREGRSAERHVGGVRQDAAASPSLQDMPLAKRRRLLQTRGRGGDGASGCDGGRRCTDDQEANTRHACGSPSPTPPPPSDAAPGVRAAAQPDRAVPGTELAVLRPQQRQQQERASSVPPSPPSPARLRQVPTPPPSPPQQSPPPPQQQQQQPLLDDVGHVGHGSGANGGGERGTTPAHGAAPGPPRAPATAPAGPAPAAPPPTTAEAGASPGVPETAGCVLVTYRRTKHEFRLPHAVRLWFPRAGDGRQTVTVYGRASEGSDGGRPGRLKEFPVSLAFQSGGWQKNGDVSTVQRKLVMTHTSQLVRWVGLGPTGQVWLRQQEVAAEELGQQQGPGPGTKVVVVVMERA